MRSPSVAPFLRFGARVFFGSSNLPLSTSRFDVTLWSSRRTTATKHFLVLSSFLIFSAPVYCQSTVSIEGQILDERGAVVQGAEITASCSSIGVTRVAKTDDVGRYLLVGLPFGNYRLPIRAADLKNKVSLSLN